MGLLAIEIVFLWSAIALIISLGAGAVIRTGERLQNEEILTDLFAAISSQQAAR
jgi:hypothetical protein